MIIYLPLVIEKTKMTRQNQYSSVVFFFMHLQMCMMGIEPTNVGATIRCVNHFATIAMAGVAGIEPTLTVLETAVLPLNYTPTYLINGAGSRT